MRNMRTHAGFTLIEATIYLGLFSLVIGGSVVAAFQVFEFAGRNQTRAIIQGEGDFLIAKMSWALSGTQSINSPTAPAPNSGCASSTQLSVTKWETAVGNPLVFMESGGYVSLGRAGNPGLPLNNTNVSVSNFEVARCWPNPSSPEYVEPRFTITARTPNGALLTQDFFTTVYIRK